jgi:hypothetical protein
MTFRVENALKAYSLRKESLEGLKKKHFGTLHVIELDATQSPLSLVKNLMERLDLSGVMSIAKTCLPQKISIPDTGFRGCDRV